MPTNYVEVWSLRRGASHPPRPVSRDNQLRFAKSDLHAQLTRGHEPVSAGALTFPRRALVVIPPRTGT